MKQSIEKLRFEYGNKALIEEELNSDPLKQFLSWFDEAVKAEAFEPNGMTLATVSESGRPSSRTVLLKKVEKKGFVFFTSYSSRKATQLKINPFGSLTFWWKEIFRQVSIEGKIKKISRLETIKYFESRPKMAQIAALASTQSAPLSTRCELEMTWLELKKKYKGKKVPCPKNWGGYCLEPERVEFWQGRANRLHDRFLYVKVDGKWVISRLFP